jgi:hypothetical protein
MAKPKTLRERASDYANRDWLGWPQQETRLQCYIAGHRAGSRLTKAERAALGAICMYERTNMQKHLDEAKELARQIMGKAVRK